MNRRSFLAALVAIATTPKLLEHVRAEPEVPLWVRNSTTTTDGMTLQKAWRKMQVHLVQGLHQQVDEWTA